MPAPPAPTMTTSYLCVCISAVSFAFLGRPWSSCAHGESRGRVEARVEGEDDQRAEHHDEQGARHQQTLEDPPGAVLLGVVVDDRAAPVEPVQLGEPEHQQVPGLPEGAAPLAGDEGEVDSVDALAQHEVDEQVPEHEDEQQDAAAPHEDPGPELEVAAALGDPAVAGLLGRDGIGAGVVVGLGGGAHGFPASQCVNTTVRCRIAKGANSTTKPMATAQKSCRWYFGPLAQKSTAMMRRPLSAWKITAATSPASA